MKNLTCKHTEYSWPGFKSCILQERDAPLQIDLNFISLLLSLRRTSYLRSDSEMSMSWLSLLADSERRTGGAHCSKALRELSSDTCKTNCHLSFSKLINEQLFCIINNSFTFDTYPDSLKTCISFTIYTKKDRILHHFLSQDLFDHRSFSEYTKQINYDKID